MQNTELNKYIDLLVTDRDVTLNIAGEPVTCNNQISIGQDVIHSIVESGLTVELIAERSPVLRDDIFTRITLLVEQDNRIIPGTVLISEPTAGRLVITAETWDFGRINSEVQL